MKHPILILLAVLCFSINLQAQRWWGRGIDGEGPRVERDLNLRDFEGVKMAMNADVYITPGNKQSVRISAQANIIDLIETDVNDGVWKIRSSENIDDVMPIKVYITIPRLTYAAVSGSGGIYGEGTFTAGNYMKVAVSGSGNLELNVNADQIEASVSGSGDIELGGSCNEFNIGVSGSGDVDADDLVTQNCDVRISGSGEAKVNASDNLKVSVSGSGDVFYRGDPNLTSRISGSGDLHRVRS